MTLESRIEASVVKLLELAGCLVPKWGKDGWPDRIVFYAPGRCLLMEIKQPGTGRVSKVQKIRHRELMRHGHTVHIVTSAAQALQLVTDARRSLARSDEGHLGDTEPAEDVPVGEAGFGQDGGGPDGS